MHIAREPVGTLCLFGQSLLDGVLQCLEALLLALLAVSYEATTGLVEACLVILHEIEGDIAFQIGGVDLNLGDQCCLDLCIGGILADALLDSLRRVIDEADEAGIPSGSVTSDVTDTTHLHRD